METFKKSEISIYIAEESVFPAPDRKGTVEFLDIGDPKFWCPFNAKFRVYWEQG